MKVTRKTKLINHKEIQYTHIENGSSVICFMFSGSGYTYDKPLFYYSTMTMLQNKFDIVHIHYSYGHDLFKLFSITDITKMVYDDVIHIINEVIENNKHDDVIFLGKSLGTIPLINGLMKENTFSNSKMILFTPLLKFDTIFESLLSSHHNALVVIGDRDPHYIPEKIEALLEISNIKVVNVPDADHSLDIEPHHTLLSLKALEGVMRELEMFVIG
ncbi:alpha/beta hydrolase [Bacillus sp. CGMCC 1.16607]|uniref:alpha/beta hydrolase n=1 Tax=Bacillus sp. CGMCC 1.16607 TaxID=3351842 RepID=UPI00362EF7F0